DRRTADDESLVEVNEVWRGIPCGADSSRDESGVNHRGDRSLDVGSGDVQREERAFRVIQRVAQVPDVLETKLDAEGLERKKTLEQRKVSDVRCQVSTRSRTRPQT